MKKMGTVSNFLHFGNCSLSPFSLTAEDIFPVAERMHIEMGEVRMGTCEVCGNQYDKAFEVSVAGGKHTFDSFECAIHALAPTCNHCGCRIVGHGVEGKSGVMFCSANCAKQEG